MGKFTLIFIQQFLIKKLSIKQISQLDFDIEQEKQRSYAYLTERKIADYLQSIISGDIDNIDVRKTIIKIFVKEIVLFNDKIIIIFNFTDRNFITALKPQSKLDYKELVNNLSESYHDCGSANNLSVPPLIAKKRKRGCLPFCFGV